MPEPLEKKPLLPVSIEGLKVEVWDRTWWRFTHALGFCLGGITFTIGTTLYFPATGYFAASNYDEVALLGLDTAWLYVIGSFGFLYVDVLEFFTFTDDPMLRLNISCSAFGSTLYVIGSAGFLPKLYSISPLIGILGFIGGSVSIGCSQAWKLCRIFSEKGCDVTEQRNAAHVEGGAMIGAWCFFIGTTMYWIGPIQGDVGCEVTCLNYSVILILWELGSLFFAFGGLSLAYRHAVMKIT